MPPKKKAEAPAEKPIIGRFKSNLKVGLCCLRYPSCSEKQKSKRQGVHLKKNRDERKSNRVRSRRLAARGCNPHLAHSLFLLPLPPRLSAPSSSSSSSSTQVGIVGLPNVGKSTLFNVLTKMGIPAENFPFCTIEPNHARVNVPDDRFRWLCDIYSPKSKVPAFLEIVDIAGLVKGAAGGEGLGNAFLSHIAAVDGIFHVCRG